VVVDLFILRSHNAGTVVENSTKNPVWGSEEDIESEKRRLGYVEDMEEPVWEGPEPEPGTPEYDKFMEYVVNRSVYARNQQLGIFIDAGASHIIANSFEEAEDI